MRTVRRREGAGEQGEVREGGSGRKVLALVTTTEMMPLLLVRSVPVRVQRAGLAEKGTGSALGLHAHAYGDLGAAAAADDDNTVPERRTASSDGV